MVNDNSKSTDGRTARVYFSRPSNVKNSNWHTIVIKKNNKFWSVSFNIPQNKVICEEVLFSTTGKILYKNPRIDLVLTKVVKECLKKSNVPPNLWRNSTNAAINQLKKEIKSEKLKLKRKSQSKGRPVQNYLRRATLEVIRRKKQEDSISKIAKEIFPIFKRKKLTQSESSFINQVRRIYRQTEISFKKETKISDLTFQDFAKNYLKPMRRLHKNKVKLQQHNYK